MCACMCVVPWIRQAAYFCKTILDMFHMFLSYLINVLNFLLPAEIDNTIHDSGSNGGILTRLVTGDLI